MSSTGIELIFEGHTVESGKIDARVLASALGAYSDLFQRANELANGRASEATVLVESDFRAGSFDVSLQLVQELLETAKSLITGHPFLSAVDLAAAIGLLAWHNRNSLIEVLKWLGGKRPERVEQIGNNFELVLFGQKKTVSNTVNIFLNDPQMRAALARAVTPLHQPGIERIRLRPKLLDEQQAGQTVIDKSEAPFFEVDTLELEAAEAPDEGERDTVLVVSKLSFAEGPKWTVYERGATVVASIEDPEFWKNVHAREYKFGEGDRLKVRLHWRMVEKRGKLCAEDTVVRVYEVVQRKKQIRIDGKKDDEV
jgi:hypothetical protein